MFYQSSNPLAATSPLRSLPLFKPAYLVLGYSEAEKADFELDRARVMLAALEGRYAAACQSLGEANKLRGLMGGSTKRRYQREAMARINSARAQLRDACARLAAAELAMTALATARA
jgi:hypothetical protein